MNIKIDKEDFEFLRKHKIVELPFGSHLYGTATAESDLDVLVLYDYDFPVANLYPNFHLLQYDAIDEKTQYLMACPDQMLRNTLTGDSTIFADLMMFSKAQTRTPEEVLNIVRTYNIIKAYIGFAKRDIKQIKKGKNKIFHIYRGLYTAECLMDNTLPNLTSIQWLYKTSKSIEDSSVDNMLDLEATLRKRCNEMFEKDELTMFPKNNMETPSCPLEQKIIDAQNIKMFKYD
jgi:predicted nucleotidyltransferase